MLGCPLVVGHTQRARPGPWGLLHMSSSRDSTQLISRFCYSGSGLSSQWPPLLSLKVSILLQRLLAMFSLCSAYCLRWSTPKCIAPNLEQYINYVFFLFAQVGLCSTMVLNPCNLWESSEWVKKRKKEKSLNSNQDQDISGIWSGSKYCFIFLKLSRWL